MKSDVSSICHSERIFFSTGQDASNKPYFQRVKRLLLNNRRGIENETVQSKEIAMINGIINMLTDHWFWGALTIACLAWYSTITIYVAIKGAADIREMLRRLSRGKQDNE